MSVDLRVAVWAMLLASAPWLSAQALETTSGSPLHNILICSRPDVLANNFELLPKPLLRPPGLNISPDCLPSWHTEFLKWDPLSKEQVPVRSGSPMICGIAYYRGVPTRVCTRG